MAKKATYAGFFELDSALEKEFKAAARSGKERKKTLLIDAFKTLDKYERKIKDEYRYMMVPDEVWKKWESRLQKHGVEISFSKNKIQILEHKI